MKNYLFAIVVSIACVACTQEPDENLEKITTTNTPYSGKMSELVKQYSDLSNAMFDEDKAEVDEEAGKLNSMLASQGIQGDAQQWNNWAENAEGHLQAIIKADDIEAKRNAFANLSEVMKTGIEVFGANEKVYWQHCPMALENKGANWVSEDPKIHNPYFGTDMATCGENQAVLVGEE